MEGVELKVEFISEQIESLNASLILLGEKDGKRKIPMLIDSEERELLKKALHDEQPLSGYEVADKLITAFDLCCLDIFIDGVSKDKFIAKLNLVSFDKEEYSIEIGAIQAIIYALMDKKPIYMDADLFEQLCTTVHPTTQKMAIPYCSLTINMLQRLLEEAVDEENYELASQLRDEIYRRK